VRRHGTNVSRDRARHLASGVRIDPSIGLEGETTSGCALFGKMQIHDSHSFPNECKGGAYVRHAEGARRVRQAWATQARGILLRSACGRVNLIRGYFWQKKRRLYPLSASLLLVGEEGCGEGARQMTKHPNGYLNLGGCIRRSMVVLWSFLIYITSLVRVSDLCGATFYPSIWLLVCRMSVSSPCTPYFFSCFSSSYIIPSPLQPLHRHRQMPTLRFHGVSSALVQRVATQLSPVLASIIKVIKWRIVCQCIKARTT